MNRRGFIGIIASAVAGAEKAFGMLPAAASSPTPCGDGQPAREYDIYQDKQFPVRHLVISGTGNPLFDGTWMMVGGVIVEKIS